MFTASYPQSSFSHFAAQESAVSFLVIQPEEQEILNNIRGWQVNKNKNSLPQHCQKQPQTSCKITEVIAKDVCLNEKVSTSKTTSNEKHTANFKNVELSIAERNLISLVYEKPLICLNKSKSLSELNVTNILYHKISQTLSQPSLTTENDNLNVVCSNFTQNTSSLTKLLKDREHSKPFNKLQSRLSKTKRKLEQLKERVMLEDTKLKKMQQERKQICEKEPCDHNLIKDIEDMTALNQTTNSYHLRKRSPNKHINDNTINRSSSVKKKSPLKSLKSINAKHLDSGSNEKLQTKPQRVVSMNNKQSSFNDNLNIPSKNIDSQESSEKYILNLISKSKLSTASCSEITSNFPNNTEYIQQVNTHLTNDQNVQSENSILSQTCTTNQNVAFKSPPVYSTYIVHNKNQFSAQEKLDMQGQKELPPMYVIGEETQKICLGMADNSSPSNSWQTDSKMSLNHSVTNAGTHAPIVVHVTSSTNASQELENICQGKDDMPPSSNELFRCSQDSQLTNHSLSTSVKRKLVFSQETPKNNFKKQYLVTNHCQSPEIEFVPKSKPISVLPENQPVLQNTNSLAVPKSVFNFTSNEVKKMLDFIWDSFS